MDSTSYSSLDRLLHRLAFGEIEIQKSIADIEDRVYSAPLAEVRLRSPVFITSLPRAGTTLLLEAVAGLPGYATHTYRNMPFLLSPLLWDGVCEPFQRQAATQLRAHGDGMTVDFDSPEAFEEPLWMAYWREKYAGRCIALWTADDRDSEFEDFFRSHMRKLVLAQRARAPIGRYVSKNNANIARLPLLRRIFPEAHIVVPFRNPLDQAASLLRQHRRFCALHARDAFAKYYMESIGHLEFGAGFKPIAFASAPEAAADADSLAFWVTYWTAAFAHVLAAGAADVRLFDFDALCASPAASLQRLGDALGEGEGAVLAARAGHFRAAVSHGIASHTLPPDITAQAQAMHEALRSRAINR